MAEALVIALRLANGILTMGFLPLIWRYFKTTGKKFYQYWAIGFFLYGVHITIRSILPLLSVQNIGSFKQFLINSFPIKIRHKNQATNQLSDKIFNLLDEIEKENTPDK